MKAQTLNVWNALVFTVFILSVKTAAVVFIKRDNIWLMYLCFKYLVCCDQISACDTVVSATIELCALKCIKHEVGITYITITSPVLLEDTAADKNGQYYKV